MWLSDTTNTLCRISYCGKSSVGGINYEGASEAAMDKLPHMSSGEFSYEVISFVASAYVGSADIIAGNGILVHLQVLVSGTTPGEVYVHTVRGCRAFPPFSSEFYSQLDSQLSGFPISKICHTDSALLCDSNYIFFGKSQTLKDVEHV